MKSLPCDGSLTLMTFDAVSAQYGTSVEVTLMNSFFGAAQDPSQPPQFPWINTASKVAAGASKQIDFVPAFQMVEHGVVRRSLYAPGTPLVMIRGSALESISRRSALPGFAVFGPTIAASTDQPSGADVPSTPRHETKIANRASHMRPLGALGSSMTS